MLRSIVLSLGFCLCFGAYSQGFQRHYKGSLALNNSAKAIFETVSGDYVSFGIVVDTLNNYQTNRLAIVGLNAQGQPQWTKKYGNKKFEYLDNQFISKWFYKQGEYIYHTGSVRDSNNKYLGVLVKFDLNGDTIWQRKFYDVAFEVCPQGVSSSIDGGFLITGFFQDATTRQCMIIKTDANGNELWRKKITKGIPNVQDGKQILQDTLTKKIVIVGYQYIGNASTWESCDNILVFDSLGTLLSRNNLSGQLGGFLIDLIQTKDKKIVAVGSTTYPETLGGNNLVKSYVLKFDLNSPSGYIWRINDYDTFSLTNYFTGILEKQNGDLILCGTIERENKKNLPDNYLNRLTWINTNGSIIKERTYQYSTNLNNHYVQSAQSITKGSNGSILAALQLFNESPNPFFVVRYDSAGCDSSIFYCQTVGLKDQEYIPIKVNVYPNPIQGKFNLEFESEIPLQFNIVDLFSQVVFESKNAKTLQEIDLSHLPRGIYFLNVDAENQRRTYKIIKE